jgi:hypothetical protein
MWHHWKAGHEVTFLEFWFHASAKFVVMVPLLSYVQSYFENWVDVETKKIEDWVFMVEGN